MKSHSQSQILAMDNKEKETAPNDFAFAVTRIAVAQITQWAGFKGAEQSALDTFTDVSARYLRAVAHSAAISATSSGRSHSNLFDIVRALEHLNAVQGFSGASNINQTLLASSTLSELATFVRCSPEIPFAKPIPRRSCPPENPGGGARNPARPENVLLHIPRWLPAIPEAAGMGINGKEAGEEENNNGSSGNGGLEEERKTTELLEKRSRVKFRMTGLRGGRVGRSRREVFGVDSRNGICRGGKRVSCQNWTEEEDKYGCTLKKPR